MNATDREKTAGEAPSDRIFAVIDCVVGNRGPVSITEIASRLDLPNPTVHRIATQLAERGYLKRAMGSKRFVPGPRLTELGLSIVGAAFAADGPHAILLALAQEIKEHCQIGVMSEGRIVYIDAARIVRSVGLQFEPGHSAPLYCTSIGKLYLAGMEDAELFRFLRDVTFERFTPTTICDAKTLLAQIETVRDKGWASTRGELTMGVVGCAVPIFDSFGNMIAGLGTSVPEAHLSFEEIERFIPILRKASQKISAALDIGTPA
ncbi:IclR family transcriptional regulator [Oceanibaculum pacificum]|uniref:IclR family transcriptional regulator n=1 Tax=Oceanibaculum pacificum TaxID=580166 RepID=A0A154W8A4_9PROT|nr:IclR family transcriptional regulator [Oceanibaculum pacificum]KZD09741.1 hypothetical protein AUP43_06740 [Oceanibaculum pacificum]